MSRRARRRPVRLTAFCWLLVCGLMAVLVGAPALGVDSIGGRSLTLAAVADGDAILPPAAGVLASAAFDDLSGSAAAGIFRLDSPTVEHAGPPPATTPGLCSRSHVVLGERGPPSRV
jgi:hypothetical protein